MTWQDYINYILFQFNYIRPQVLMMVALTVIMLLFLSLMSRNLSFESHRFGWLSLFYKMNGYTYFRLSCAWLRLVYLISILVLFRPLEPIHYVMYIMIGLLYLLDIKAPHRIMSNLLNLTLELIGVIATNVLCGYMIEVFMDFQYLAIYILISVFFGCFGIYVFLLQLIHISDEREVDKNEFKKQEDKEINRKEKINEDSIASS